MTEQAGVYRITFYENKGLGVTYNQDNTIKGLSNTGDVINIENSDCDTMEIDFTLDSRRSNNNNRKYKHSIKWNQLGLDNIDLINTLKHSIYGWIPEIEFYNKETKVLLNPLKFVESSINNNLSNHYTIELNNINFGDIIKEIIEQFNYVFEDGNNYVFEDGNNYIFE